MNYYLFIPLFFIILLFIPIKLEGRASFNALALSGAVGVFLYKFKIARQRFKIQKREIIWLVASEEQEVELNQSRLIFIKMFLGEIKDKTRFQELFIMYNLGIGDAFTTSMIAGHINALLYAGLVSIKNYKPTASLGVCDSISFNKMVCTFAVNMKISISLFDIVYSLLRSVILTKKATKLLNSKEKV
ncbi:MAG: hypothetical protein E7379_04275 [Clostridiales bacterium]|nr:hypothetical protein [Clostridiales bacterium]